ncbi:hypothetical protein SUGI_0212820 [Cryptomeria japonica]|nr:hypothetical protein SUGI_0212820 [Cryptomeria japonica]
MNSSLYRSLNSPSTPAFYKLQHSNIEDYYYSALHRCKTIKQLLGIHAQVNKIGVNQRISVAIKLVNKYAEYRNVENARLMQLGEEIPNSFTTVNVLAACGQLGYLHQEWLRT